MARLRRDSSRLIASVGVRWSALYGLASLDLKGAALALIAAAGLSRLAFPILMRALPPARRDGLSYLAGRPGPGALAVAGLSAFAVVGLCLDPGAALTAVIGFACALFAVGLMARKHIQGQTGDVLGAAQQVCEPTILIGILLSWSI